MNRRLHRIVSVSFIVLLLAPSVAAACPIDMRRIGPLNVRKAEIKRPIVRTVSRSAWRIDDSWTATYPELNQQLVVRRVGLVESASFPTQRALSIDAAAPDDLGWRYADDDDPISPPCAIAGKGEWQPPVIMVKEDRRRIRVAAVARRTVGSRTGCVLDTEQVRDCPALTRRVLRLKHRVGARRIVFELVR